MRRVHGIAIALLSGALTLAPATWADTPAAAAKKPLEVHFIDVGQGDGILIRSPAGKTILIDAGNIEAGEVVDAYLTKLGVTTIDLVMVSHPHLDHMGGLLEVLKHHRPVAYIDPGYAHPLENYDELLDWLETQAIPVKQARAGRTITVEPGLTLELFMPVDPLLKGTRSDANSNSIVAKLTYGAHSFLFTGDSEDETEERVMRSGAALESTVLKVAHHGGKHSTSNSFLGRVEPEFAVISCGNLNSYKHPTPETLGRLSSRGTKIYRTDLDGDVIARTDGKTLKWETTGMLSAKLDEKGGKRSYYRGSGAKDAAHDHGPKRGLAVGLGGSGANSTGVDLNTADEAELKSLPGIGDAMARAIVADRAKNGPYADVDALMRIKGIARGKVDRIRPMVTTSKTAIPVASPTQVAATPAMAPAPAVPPSATGAAPRPVARPGAFRATARTLALAKTEPVDEGPTSTRLLGGPRRSRLNLNLAGAESIARGADISVDQARRVVEDRLANGPFRRITDVARVKGLGDEERAALFKACTVRIELNGATTTDLMALGLERGEARAIVEWRENSGDFASIDDLEEVEDLPPQKRHAILPLLTVESRGRN